MFASNINTSARNLSSPAWTGVLALALSAIGIASTHGDAPRVRMVYEAGFCGRCIDWYDTIHIAAADPTRRFGVGPARPSVEETPWHAQVVRDGDCLWTHGICHNARGSKPRDPAELTTELAEAVGLKDIATLASLVELPAVRLVSARSAIQVVACDGESVVGHVPVDRDLLETVESHLPTPE